MSKKKPVRHDPHAPKKKGKRHDPHAPKKAPEPAKMIWSATQLRSEPARVVMLASGVATILYNWENYKRVRDAEAIE